MKLKKIIFFRINLIYIILFKNDENILKISLYLI